MRAQVFVATKAPDPVAQTALSTLTRRLGFGDSLVALRRRIYYELDLARVSGDPRQTLRDLLSGSTLLANPNKHTTEVWMEPDCVPVPTVAILVWDREGARGRALEARIAREIPRLEGISVRWGTLWLPEFRGPDDQHLTLAGTIATGGRRDAGLLSNPNADRHTVFAGRLPHGVLS